MFKSKAAILLSAITIISGTALADLNNGLVSYYQFDESSGVIAHDSVGSINGMLQGGTLFVQNEGIRGGAVKLDKATGDYIDPDLGKVECSRHQLFFSRFKALGGISKWLYVRRQRYFS